MTTEATCDSMNSAAATQTKTPRILAFEMQVGGHHPSYIRNIARLWADRQMAAQINFLVTPRFVDAHRDVFDEVNQLAPDRVIIDSISQEEEKRIGQTGFQREFKAWNVFCDHAKKRQADHGLLMYSDHFQLPMLFGQASPCPLSCVYFRPTFHYCEWPEHQMDLKQHIAGFRKKILLKQVLKVKQLKHLFCLDEFVPAYIEQTFNTHVKPLVLPDSFVRYETTDANVTSLRNELEIESGRQVLLLLGIMDSRKGPVELLDAAISLPTTTKQKLCLLLVGKIDPSIEQTVLARVNQLRTEAKAQVIVRNEYVPDTFVQHYYEVADVALTTYQQHKGMSSALMRAALAEAPVLSSSYGLMGEIVRRHEMGTTVDTASPEAFSVGLKDAISGECARAFNVEAALAFANQHSPEALGKALENWVQQISPA